MFTFDAEIFYSVALNNERDRGSYYRVMTGAFQWVTQEDPSVLRELIIRDNELICCVRYKNFKKYILRHTHFKAICYLFRLPV